MPDQHSMLIVDDELNILKSLKRLLIDTDYKVLTCESGAEGLEKLSENKVHLVISDYRMPEMDGVEFLSKVKESYPETIRLILSGFADAAAMVGAINDGQVYKFITKPWNDQELLTTIMRAFEQYDLQVENRNLYARLKQSNDHLQELTRSLEEEVKTRTRDLEVKNSALNVSQRILNYLPVGVLGIDISGNIVYLNRSLSRFISTIKLCLGSAVSGAVDSEIVKALMSAIVEKRMIYLKINDRGGIGLVCSPLTDNTGAIGVFYWLEPFEHLDESKGTPKEKGAIYGNSA